MTEKEACLLHAPCPFWIDEGVSKPVQLLPCMQQSMGRESLSSYSEVSSLKLAGICLSHGVWQWLQQFLSIISEVQIPKG